MSVPWTNETLSRCRAVVMAVAIGGAALAGSASAESDEFGYSGDKGPGFWGETPGWEAWAGTAATLSEHRVHGRHGVMELHAVFADPRSDKKAVIGMLDTIGRKNAFLSELLANGLPRKTGDEVTVPSQFVNLAHALIDTSRYYTYPG